MKKYFVMLVKRKKAELEELERRSDESNDAAEVRSIGETMKKLKDEIEEAEAALEEIENEEGNDGSAGTEGRSSVPEGAQLRNGIVVGSFSGGGVEDEDLTYRKAFMNYVMRDEPIPAEVRENESTTTGDVGAVIPTVIVNDIIEKFENTGMILSLVTRTSFPAGLQVPKSTVKPVAVWVGEGKGSDRQKKTTGKIQFTNHKLRCEISMSMEVGTMALAIFEKKFTENVVKAMVKTSEGSIINGTGTDQPKGILKEEVIEDQKVIITNGVMTFETLCSMEAAIPEEYESTAVWCMSKKTFMKFYGITDENKQPVARTNYGVTGKPERYLLGREVKCASAHMPTLKADVANVFAFACDFSDYDFNTIYDMGISKKQDWDTEDLLTKAVMSADGKMISNESLVTVENQVGA